MKLIPESMAFDAINSALNFDTIDGRVVGGLESYSCKLVGQEKALYKKFSSSVQAGMSEMEVLSPPRDDEGLLSSSPYYFPSNADQPLYRRAQSSPSGKAGTGRFRTTSLNIPQASASSLSQSSNSTVSQSTSCGSAGHLDSEGEGVAQEEDMILRKTLFYLVSTLNASFYPDYDFSRASSMEFSKERSLQHVMNTVESQLRIVSQSQLTGVSEQLWRAVDEAITLKDCEIYTYNPDDTSDPYSDDCCIWSFNYFFYNMRLKRIVFLTCRLVSNDTFSEDYNMDSDIDFQEY